MDALATGPATGGMLVLHPAPDEESDEGKIREDALTSLFRLSFPEEAFSFSQGNGNFCDVRNCFLTLICIGQDVSPDRKIIPSPLGEG